MQNMCKIIKFSIFADFGFFKKPDINEVGLTFSLPPRPGILGIIGSILGLTGLKSHYEIHKFLRILSLESQKKAPKAQIINQSIYEINKKAKIELRHGYNFKKNNYSKLILEITDVLENTKQPQLSKKLKVLRKKLETMFLYPQYYRCLKHLKIGIIPICEFPPNKTLITYNSRNSYFSEKEDNVLIKEQLIIEPNFEVYIFSEKKNDPVVSSLIEKIKSNSYIYTPYMGKNDFLISFYNFGEYRAIENSWNSRSQIDSFFLLKNDDYGDDDDELEIDFFAENQPDRIEVKEFYERYPVSYINENLQYKTQLLKLTNKKVNLNKVDLERGKLFEVEKKVIYVF